MNFVETLMSEKLMEKNPLIDVLAADRKVLQIACQDLVNYLKIHWDLVGQRPAKVVLGKNSGLDSIKMHLQRLRVKATEDQVNELVLRVKTASLKKKGER